MTALRFCLSAALATACVLPAFPQEKPDLKRILAQEIVGPQLPFNEIQDYLEARVPRLAEPGSAAEWDRRAAKIRADVLEKVVLRGEAAGWAARPTKAEWLGEIEGGVGYRIRRLRYEAVPGLWIPGLLYVPDGLAGRVPVHLAVNGHDGTGKAAGYKQARCINLAKRGMIVLNLEWLGMGQLRAPGFAHSRMNQLDLCGTSGLAPFYLSMKRGLDILLSLEHADPARVAVHGLSGGGWQTIVISALDTRVTLSNPVAGYSSYRTRVRHLKDLGDSEQTPCDLASVADYTHLTAMMAPRPTLLTYNSKDNCCFESGYALPPLEEAARPAFRLHGKEESLRTHVNDDPGTHNFEVDNRQALYRMIGDHWFAGSKTWDAREIPCKEEIRTAAQLEVELPKENADFNALARSLAAALPRDPALPGDGPAAAKWREERRALLRGILRARDLKVAAEEVGSGTSGGVRYSWWRLRMDDAFTVPVVELVPAGGEPVSTVLLVSEAGRASAVADAERLLAGGARVLAIDPFYFGESKIAQKDWLFAILLASVGERPLGLQAAQLAAAARWAEGRFKGAPRIVALGPRSSLAALAAAGLEEKAVAGLELHRAYGSLKEILEQSMAVNAAPELFCFGLLEAFDVRQLVALAAPRPVRFAAAGDRARAELGSLADHYRRLGIEFDPLR